MRSSVVIRTNDNIQCAPMTNFIVFIMAMSNLKKLNRNYLIFIQQTASEETASEILTGLPRSVINRIALLDMDEIDQMAELLPVSLFTFRLTEQSFNLLIQLPRDAKSTYAEAALVGNEGVDASFP
jgi:flagellar transcriptional activator FlhD